ncbi:MAG: hypothetical protein AAF527_12820 [Pseudomonadota bacterium]
MTEQARLFPAMIASLALLFSLKIFGVWTGVSAAIAQEAEAETASLTEEESAGAEDDDAEAGGEDGPTADAEAEAAQSPEDDMSELSPTELRVLKSLAERRSDLDARERELDTQSKLLQAAELRVAERIDELKQIEMRINQLLQKRDEHELAQIERLVKVYERMKPKEAARIFETLDQDILLDVASRMKEATVAGVMAQMSPQAAQGLTVQLATRTRLPDEADAVATP